MKKLFLLIPFLFLVGCTPNPNAVVPPAIRGEKSPSLKLQYIDEYLSYEAILPDGVSNFRDLGNGWMTFDMDVAGKTRTFMYARFKSASGYAVPAFTELTK